MDKGIKSYFDLLRNILKLKTYHVNDLFQDTRCVLYFLSKI